MGRKPKATHYTEMRNVTETMTGGRGRLKHEVVPGLYAWLMLLSRRYHNQAMGFRDRMVLDSVPGMREGAERMEWACQHLQWIANALLIPFNRGEYLDCANEVCKLLGIPEEGIPAFNLADRVFEDTLATVPDGSHEGPSGEPVQPSVAPPPERPRPARKPAKGRSRGRR